MYIKQDQSIDSLSDDENISYNEEPINSKGKLVLFSPAINKLTGPTFFSHRKEVDNTLLILPQLIDCVRMLEKFSSARSMANRELKLGITSLLAFIATPIAFYVAFLNYLNYSSKSNRLSYVAYSLLLMIFLVIPLTFVCSAFYTLVLIQGYEGALKQYDSLSYRFADQSDADRALLYNLLKVLNVNNIDPKLKKTLKLFKEFKTEYDGVITFWKSPETTILPADIFRKILSSMDNLLKAEKNIDAESSSINKPLLKLAI
ncbi:MAG: hypothetical protein H0U57_13570 [Tatlockia sp.]|nr:hypothetical protein [Tatlockia sp.]